MRRVPPPQTPRLLQLAVLALSEWQGRRRREAKDEEEEEEEEEEEAWREPRVVVVVQAAEVAVLLPWAQPVWRPQEWLRRRRRWQLSGSRVVATGSQRRVPRGVSPWPAGSIFYAAAPGNCVEWEWKIVMEIEDVTEYGRSMEVGVRWCVRAVAQQGGCSELSGAGRCTAARFNSVASATRRPSHERLSPQILGTLEQTGRWDLVRPRHRQETPGSLSRLGGRRDGSASRRALGAGKLLLLCDRGNTVWFDLAPSIVRPGLLVRQFVPRPSSWLERAINRGKRTISLSSSASSRCRYFFDDCCFSCHTHRRRALA